MDYGLWELWNLVFNYLVINIYEEMSDDQTSNSMYSMLFSFLLCDSGLDPPCFADSLGLNHLSACARPWWASFQLNRRKWMWKASSRLCLVPLLNVDGFNYNTYIEINSVQLNAIQSIQFNSNQVSKIQCMSISFDSNQEDAIQFNPTQ